MDNYNNPPTPQPGSESLNERLRRAAENARRNMASQPSGDAPQPFQPALRQTPVQPTQYVEPTPSAQPSPRFEEPTPRPYTAPAAPDAPSYPTNSPYAPQQEYNTPQQEYSAPQPRPTVQPAATTPSAPPRPTVRPDAATPRPAASPRPVKPLRPATPLRPSDGNIPPTAPGGPGKPEGEGGSGKKSWLMIALGALLMLAIVAVVVILIKSNADNAAQQQQIEQLQLQNEQIQLANEYENLNNEFAQYENQTSLLANDSIVQKYAAARAQVEKLLAELQNEKNKSAAQIQQLKSEIETLKGILRTYLEQIRELKEENQSLRSENDSVRAQNSQLTQTVQSVQASNEHLNERITLAEKLNVTGISLTPLNKKGKKEKKVSKARQLEVSFTIPQNNSTPVGKKTIYLRIVSPEGDVLGNAGTFSFEGATIKATAQKIIEYQGEEIGGIKIYWDVNSTLNPGSYTVELFADNYRLASRSFELK